MLRKEFELKKLQMQGPREARAVVSSVHERIGEECVRRADVPERREMHMYMTSSPCGLLT